MKKKTLLALVSIIALGALLRLYNLSVKPIWFDEASNIVNALKEFNLMSRPPYNYKIFFFCLLKIWLNIFGIGVFSSRLLSVLLGVSSIFFIFKIGKNLFNEKTGLIASFLLAISVFHVTHCQQVGPAVLLLFLTLISFDSFIDLFQKIKKVYLVINLLVNILIIYTYPFGFLVILIQLFFVSYNYRSLEGLMARKWLFYSGALILFGSVLLPMFFKEQPYFKSVLWWAKPPLATNIVETFSTFSYGGPRYGLEDVNIKTCPFIVAFVLNSIFLVFFIKGLFKIIKDKIGNSESINDLLITWVFLPLSVLFLFSYFFFPVYFIRKFLFFLPAFYLIVAAGMSFEKIKFSLVLLCVIFLLNLPIYKIMYNSNYNVDWEMTVSLMKQKNIKSDATIIIGTCKELAPFMFYFSQANKDDLRDISMFGKIVDGKWSNNFIYKEHRMVCLFSEYYKRPRINPRKYFEYNRFGCDYFIKEFDRKFFKTSFFNLDKPVWLLMSRWAVSDDSCLQKAIDKFKLVFDLQFETEIRGVKIFYFERKI